MRWTPERAREHFVASRSARLATADGDAQPHVVPVTFAVYGDTLAIAVDHKPKSTRALKRLANIEANPAVSLLVDHYSDEWAQLWWARVDGEARIVTGGPEHQGALAHLIDRYRQYRERPPDGPVILVTVRRWSGWSFR